MESNNFKSTNVLVLVSSARFYWLCTSSVIQYWVIITRQKKVAKIQSNVSRKNVDNPSRGQRKRTSSTEPDRRKTKLSELATLGRIRRRQAVCWNHVMSDISETLVEHVYISVGYHSLGDNLRGAKTSLSTSKVSVLYKERFSTRSLCVNQEPASVFMRLDSAKFNTNVMSWYWCTNVDVEKRGCGTPYRRGDVTPTQTCRLKQTKTRRFFCSVQVLLLPEN